MKKILSMITLTVLMVALAGSCTKNLEERLDKADADLASVRTAIGQYEKLQSDITTVVQSLQNEVGSRPASEQQSVWNCIAALQNQNNTVSAAISALKALVGEESVSDQIAEALAELTDSYDLDNLEATLQALKAEVAEKFDVKLLESKVENLSKTIRNFDYYLAKLLEIEGMLQSVSIIPQYDDGSIKADAEGLVKFECAVTPASVLADISDAELAKCFTLTLSTVGTKAGESAEIAVTSAVAGSESGIVKITADISDYIPEDDSQTLMLALNLKLGASNYSTDFVKVTIVYAAPEGFVYLGVKNAKGKPLYWAKKNLGANNPWDYGDYYMWGAPVKAYTKLEGTSFTFGDKPEIYKNETWDKYWCFCWENCNHTNGKHELPNHLSVFTKYVPQDQASTYGKDGFYDDKTVLDPEDDAATATTEDWRTPTSEEFQALCDKCYWEWTDNYNGTSVKGVIVYKSKNGGDKGKYGGGTGYTTSDIHIFLPAAGFGMYQTLYPGTQLEYMSSTLSPESPDCFCELFVRSEVKEVSLDHVRFAGCPIRPVTEVSELH